MTGVLAWFIRRVVYGALTVLVVAFITYGLIRVLHPESYDPGPDVLGGTLDDLGRGFLHWDWGVARGWAGAPAITDMFARGFAADLWMIGGALVTGIGFGLLVAMWCARRPGTRRARAAQVAVSVLYCTPVYVLGGGLLLLFNRNFGLVPVPAFFDAESEWAQPWTHPWLWLTTLAVPCLVLAAPVAAMCQRLALGILREEGDADYVRTAIAKGVSPRKVMSRHTAPVAYTATASLVGVSVPLIVVNLVLVETVFGVPGFAQNTWRALGHVLDGRHSDPVTDIPMLQAISVWAAVLIVVLGIAVDVALVRLDPRIRDGGLPG